jgi:hypothetical protein
MNRSALFLLLPLLAACNVHSKSSANDNDNVSVRADQGGNISFDVPFVKGQVKVPAGFMSKGDIDIEGVKLMPGSQVTGFSVFAQDKGSIVNMSFTAPAAPDAVRSYFVDQFSKQGVAATTSGDAVTGKSKDGNPFRIEVGPAASGSQGKIVVQDKD